MVDVGTDHALLPIHLVESGQAQLVIATDVADGPVQAAHVNVERYGLSQRISVRCGDGLQTVQPGEVDTVVIAGMGGCTAVKILQDAPDVVAQVRRLVIQPMNASRQVREFFLRMKFDLVDESLLIDDGLFYEVLVADIHGNLDAALGDTPRGAHDDVCGGGDAHDAPSGGGDTRDAAYDAYRRDEGLYWMALEFGPHILSRGGEVLGAYMRDVRGALMDVLRGLEHGKSEAARTRQMVVEEHLTWIDQWMHSKEGNV